MTEDASNRGEGPPAAAGGVRETFETTGGVHNPMASTSGRRSAKSTREDVLPKRVYKSETAV